MVQINYGSSLWWFGVQYDAFDLGVITTDEFTNAEIVETTYPTVLRRLQEESERCKKFARGPTIPVVTGFLGKVGDIMKPATCPFHHAKEVWLCLQAYMFSHCEFVLTFA